MLITGETGWRVYGTSLLSFFTTLCIFKTILKNKVYLKKKKRPCKVLAQDPRNNLGHLHYLKVKGTETQKE